MTSPPVPPQATLGVRFAEARQRLGWTLRDAERVSGVPNAHISQIETGTIAQPGPAIVAKLARAYGLDDLIAIPPRAIDAAAKAVARLKCVQAGWAFGVPEDGQADWLRMVTCAALEAAAPHLAAAAPAARPLTVLHIPEPEVAPVTALEDLDRWLPPRGPCLICGVPGMDARHRVIDAITGAAEAGEAADDIADELGLPPEAVQAALRWAAEDLMGRLP